MQFHGYHTLGEISSALAVETTWLAAEFQAFNMPKLQFEDGTEHFRSQDIEQFLRKRAIQIQQEQTRLRRLLADVEPNAREAALELDAVCLPEKHNPYDEDHLYRSIKKEIERV